MTKEQVLEKLKEVIDPELGINIVDLGLIYDIDIQDSQVRVKMTLTSPGCPLHSFFTRQVEEKIKGLTRVKKILVELTYDPPWTPERMSGSARKKLGGF